MSVRTTADEKVESAKDHIREAARDLSEVVISECYGHDGYTDDYKESLREIMNDLLALKQRIV